MKEDDHKILGPTGVKGWDYIRSKGFGGRLLPEDFHEYETFTEYCSRNGNRLSPDAWLDLFRKNNKINLKTESIAKKCNLPVLSYRDEVIDAFIEGLDEIDKELFAQSDEIHQGLLKEAKQTIVRKIKSIVPAR